MHQLISNRQKGFTLLEAIVALVLIATVGMTLLAWINSQLITLQRIQDKQRADVAIQNTLDFIQTLNPLQQPTGKANLGMYQISWQSTLLEPAKDGKSPAGTLSYFQVGLFEMDVQVAQNEQEIITYQVRQAGYKQVRFPEEPDSPFFFRR
ncbi:type II secretion system protein [Candidatus Venteria ishoeyi]|uniref:type II secretion system protein n=1 Tax=Candidatus Venteria ishoeyi TaxID=1899563 RepID=UPI0025A62DFC|nr:type II secretion system protein [Candidatus Venteria ishoeyi]MDM8545786.1 type II secretion system protein [Candidatus Venteria ishoeyi]